MKRYNTPHRHRVIKTRLTEEEYAEFSERVTLCKMSQRIFEIALKKINKNPSECIFVDNSAANLNVSKEIGICPILFNRDKVEYTGITVNTFEELADILNDSNL
ncbi:HAD family hydrolase [Turicimonas muris]|uniref:HAD family hydrolase n=1 Tax=Turicimonas muris TaxID=1796652 RepID=UPI0025B6EB7A|nr:HAD-IA family hydrolase [Turicimonas muris]